MESPEKPTPEEVAKYQADYAIPPTDKRPGNAARRAVAKAWLIVNGYLEDDTPPEPPARASTIVLNSAIGNLTHRAIAAARTEPPPRPVPLTTCAADVVSEPVGYLWPGRIPSSRITIFMGMPDQGKSWLMSWLTAVVTTGGRWPDVPESAEKGTVIILQAEESRAEDIAARLERFGADRGKIEYWDGVDRGDGKGVKRIALGRDYDALEVLFDRYPDVRAVIIDPLGAYLGDSNSKSTEDTYEALLPLKDLAERRKVAIIVVAHPNKDGEQNIVHRLSGSQAFGAIARAFWYVSEDPNDSTRRMISLAKGNPEGLNPKPLAWSKSPDGSLCFDADAGDMRAKHVEFLLQRNLKQEALRARRGPEKTKRKDAEALILEALAAGPMLRSRLKKKVVSADISEPSFRRSLNGLEDAGRVARVPLGEGRKGFLFRLCDDPDPAPATLPFPPDPHTPRKPDANGVSDPTCCGV